MTITVNVQELHVHLAPRNLEASLSTILSNTESIMNQQTEAATALRAVAAQQAEDAATLAKVKDETTSLLVKIQTLEDLANQQSGDLDPDLAAAIQEVTVGATSVRTAIGAVDTLVADTPPAP